MNLTPPPFDAALDAYQKQAEELLTSFREGNPGAIKLFHERLPRFLDEKVPWKPKDLTDEEIRSTPLELADARLALARYFDFRDWPALAQYVAAVAPPGSPLRRFESAVEAVVNGDASTLERMLRDHPDLVRARSTRVTHFDPPVHEATLLHYVAANGVERYRQKTPGNAVAIARLLLESGAEPDALAAMYGGRCTTMSMLVSSCHPANAGLQVALVDTLIDYGAAVDERGSGNWTSPLMTALVFGYHDAAQALVRRGAKVDRLEAAAGLGRLDDATRMLPNADAASRHRALALASQLGRVEVVRLLLDAGEDPNRYNPEGCHAHGTPLHQAVWFGHDPVVRLLVERGAKLDIKDKLWKSTPLGWAEYGGRKEIAQYLRSRGSKTMGNSVADPTDPTA